MSYPLSLLRWVSIEYWTNNAVSKRVKDILWHLHSLIPSNFTERSNDKGTKVAAFYLKFMHVRLSQEEMETVFFSAFEILKKFIITIRHEKPTFSSEEPFLKSGRGGQKFFLSEADILGIFSIELVPKL